MEMECYISKFDTEKGCNNALSNGSWTLAGAPIYLKKWEADEEGKLENFKAISLWVQLYGNLLQCWSDNGFSRIASFLRVHIRE